MKSQQMYGDVILDAAKKESPEFEPGTEPHPMMCFLGVEPPRLRLWSTWRWRLELSRTSARDGCFLLQDHARHVQGSHETDRANDRGKDCTPTKWSSPADKCGSLKSEGPTDIRKKCTGQPSN